MNLKTVFLNELEDSIALQVLPASACSADSFEFVDPGHHVSEQTIAEYTKVFESINKCVHYPDQNANVDPVVVQNLLPGSLQSLAATNTFTLAYTV